MAKFGLFSNGQLLTTAPTLESARRKLVRIVARFPHVEIQGVMV